MGLFPKLIQKATRTSSALVSHIAGQSPHTAGACVSAGILMLSIAARDLGLSQTKVVYSSRTNSYFYEPAGTPQAGFLIALIALLLLGAGGAALWRWRRGFRPKKLG